MDFLTYWGQWIHTQRRALGLSPEEFARMTHISSNQIYHIEQGKGDSRRDTLDKLMSVLDSDAAFEAIREYAEPKIERYLPFIQAEERLDPAHQKESLTQIFRLLN